MGQAVCSIDSLRFVFGSYLFRGYIYLAMNGERKPCACVRNIHPANAQTSEVYLRQDYGQLPKSKLKAKKEEPKAGLLLTYKPISTHA